MESSAIRTCYLADHKEVALSAPTGALRAIVAEAGGCQMQYFPKNLFRTTRNAVQMLTRRIPAPMFRSMVRVAVHIGLASSLLASLANAQISPNLPNPTAAPNPLTRTLSIFRSNMQDKIMKSADAMPESKYSYRPTTEVRSFGEILNHIANISYTLCSNAKGESPPAPPAATGSKAEIIAYVKGSFDYCDGVYAGFTDAHLNDPANFFGFRTNKMFILTQVGNHDALHYGNLVTYMRLNGLVPSGGWF
jgi:uncharacterized damage-inducible protein DinB